MALSGGADRVADVDSARADLSVLRRSPDGGQIFRCSVLVPRERGLARDATGRSGLPSDPSPSESWSRRYLPELASKSGLLATSRQYVGRSLRRSRSIRFPERGTRWMVPRC